MHTAWAHNVSLIFCYVSCLSWKIKSTFNIEGKFCDTGGGAECNVTHCPLRIFCCADIMYIPAAIIFFSKFVFFRDTAENYHCGKAWFEIWMCSKEGARRRSLLNYELIRTRAYYHPCEICKPDVAATTHHHLYPGHTRDLSQTSHNCFFRNRVKNGKIHYENGRLKIKTNFENDQRRKIIYIWLECVPKPINH